MTRPNSASCFWKSACWIRLISDPPQAATTFSWTPPNGTEWIQRNFKKPWPRNLPRNKRRQQKSSRRLETRRQHKPCPSLISGGVLVCTPPFSIGDWRPRAAASMVFPLANKRNQDDKGAAIPSAGPRIVPPIFPTGKFPGAGACSERSLKDENTFESIRYNAVPLD